MSYKRTTKDVVCKKCGKPNRVPVGCRIGDVVCAKRHKGFRCLGDFRLKKASDK